MPRWYWPYTYGGIALLGAGMMLSSGAWFMALLILAIYFWDLYSLYKEYGKWGGI